MTGPSPLRSSRTGLKVKNCSSNIRAKKTFSVLSLGVLAILDVLGSVSVPIIMKAIVSRPLEAN